MAHRPGKNVRVGQGAHDIYGLHGRCAATHGVTVHHYPVRSYEQFEAKVIRGGQVYAHYQGPQAHGSHWRYWYDQYQAGKLREVYDALCVTPANFQRLLDNGRIAAAF